METVSPPVSPSVVQRILMIQKPKVTCGTFERMSSFVGVMESPGGGEGRGATDRRITANYFSFNRSSRQNRGVGRRGAPSQEFAVIGLLATVSILGQTAELPA